MLQNSSVFGTQSASYKSPSGTFGVYCATNALLLRHICGLLRHIWGILCHKCAFMEAHLWYIEAHLEYIVPQMGFGKSTFVVYTTNVLQYLVHLEYITGTFLVYTTELVYTTAQQGYIPHFSDLHRSFLYVASIMYKTLIC